MSSTSLPAEIVKLIDKLQLQPHPEGGFYRETWRSNLSLPQSILPAAYTGDRSAELWFHQAGDPLELVMAENVDGATQIIQLGRDHTFQAVVPPNYWQKAQPVPGAAGYALVACVVVPGFDFADFELIATS
jgi:uncharacterized protein